MIHDPSNNRLNGGFIKKSKDQFLREAAAEIAELKKSNAQLIEEAKAGGEHINQVEWQRDQARMALTAVGNKYNISPEEMKKIFNEHMAKVEAMFLEKNDEAKKQFIADLKAGKKVAFEINANPDAPAGGN